MKKVHAALIMAATSLACVQARAEADTNSEVYKKTYADELAKQRAARNLPAESATDSTKTESSEPVAATQSSVEFFLQGNGAYTRHVAEGVGTNLYGAEAAVGINFARTNLGFWTTQLSVGYMKTKDEPIFAGTLSLTQQTDAVPFLFAAHYNFAISKSGNSTFFVGPFAGGYFVKNTITSGSTKISANDSMLAGGIDIGFNFNLVEQCDLVLSGSAGKIGGADFDYGNGISRTIDSGEIYTIRAGVKFRF